MKFKVTQPYPVKTIGITSHDLANMLPNIFRRTTHTGYTPKGTIVTASFNSLKKMLEKAGVDRDEEEDFDEQIVEAIKLVVDMHRKHFEYTLYRDPRDPSHTELGLRFHLNPKS